MDGTTTYKTVEVENGESVAKPATPTKEGYNFLGWYSGAVEYDFSSKVINDITLTAKWEQIKTPAKEETTEKTEDENKVTE